MSIQIKIDDFVRGRTTRWLQHRDRAHRRADVPERHNGAGDGRFGRLIVEFGDHKRNILAGIKQERPDPSEIEGQQALFVVNLESRKMMGELSEGMLFDIGYADGITPVLAVPEKPVPNGSRAG